MTNQTNPTPSSADDVREGPQPLPTRYSCEGCKHLKTEWWKDYLDNDETDSGTSATCMVVEDGKSITAYWSKGSEPPKWCPFRQALSSPQPDLVEPSADVVELIADALNDHLLRREGMPLARSQLIDAANAVQAALSASPAPDETQRNVHHVTALDGFALDPKHLDRARLIADRVCAGDSDFSMDDAEDVQRWFDARNAAWAAFHSAETEAPAPSQSGLVETLSDAMRTAWDDICSDTGYHPVDIQHGRGKQLTFEPNHWVRAIAMHLNTNDQTAPDAGLLKLGDVVEFAPHVPDSELWNRNGPYYVTMIQAEKHRGINVAVCPVFPWEQGVSEGMTDGFYIDKPDCSPDDLVPRTNAQLGDGT